MRAANSWRGYKRSKSMTCAIEALYRNNKLSLNCLKVLEDTTAIVVKAITITYEL